MGCPHCSSQNIVRNGHHYGGKLHFLCNTCHKHFTEDVLKGYPVSKIPYPLIGYFLYFRKKIPEFSNMRIFRKFVSQWLECLGIRTKDISRQTIHHWINQYDRDLEIILSFQEARDYTKQLLAKQIREIPQEIIHRETIPHTDALQIVQEIFGREFCVNLLRKDKIFFNELCDIISKYRVYCWNLLAKKDIKQDIRLLLRGH